MDIEDNKQDDGNTFTKEALLCEIGAKLTQTREAQGLSKAHVVKELKFNATFLDALESGSWSEMPGEIYALGFLRQYADLLGLDLVHDIDRIKTNTYELTTPLTYPDAAISPNRTWAIVAALIFILVMIISNLFTSDHEDTQQQSAEAAQNIPKLSMPQENPQATLVQNGVSSTQSKQITIEPKKKLMITKQHNENTDIALQSFTFIAVSDDVWLQVYEKGTEGKLKLRREALLRKGQSFMLDTKTKFLLTSGKSIALKVLLNNQVLYDKGSLGEEGKVLKLFPLQ